MNVNLFYEKRFTKPKILCFTHIVPLCFCFYSKLRFLVIVLLKFYATYFRMLRAGCWYSSCQITFGRQDYEFNHNIRPVSIRFCKRLQKYHLIKVKLGDNFDRRQYFDSTRLVKLMGNLNVGCKV